MRLLNFAGGFVWVSIGGLMLGFGDPAKAADPPAKAAQKNADPLFPITISQETTRITKPLKPDGTPDYAAALNARLSENLKPEDNAGAILIPVIGVNELPEESREAFFKALGVPPLGEPSGSLRNFAQIMESHAKKPRERSNLWDQQSAAMSRPWSKKEFPLVADWVDGNAEALRISIAASQKDRFFIPLTTTEKDPLVASTILGPVQNMRGIARLLRARAMLAIEEGRIDDAQADLLACHRLGSLLGQQPTMIESLVSYAIDAVACAGDRVLAQSPKVSQKQLAAYRNELENLPPIPKIGETIDQGERFVSLDAICNLAMQQDEAAANAIGLPNSKVFVRMLGLSIDWDLIMKEFNTRYDRIVTALALPTFAERKAEIAEIDRELKELREDVNKPAQFALMFLGVNPPRAVVSRQMGNVLFALLIPAVEQAAEAETRTQTRRDLTIIALALAEHERENGEYPAKLSDLSPKYLKTIPSDHYTDQPLKYEREDKGYVLYSLGPNGKDDKGRRHFPDANADDQAIRVPEQPEL